MNEMDDKTQDNINNTQKQIDDVHAQNDLADNLRSKDPGCSLRHAQNAEDLARSISYSLGVANALRAKTFAHHRIGDYYNALKSAEEAFQLYELLNQNELKSKLLIKVGGIYSELGDLAQGLKMLLEALDFFKEANDRKTQADILYRIGILHSLMENSNLAVENYLQSIEIYNELGHTLAAARTHNSCCVDYTILSEYKEAEKHGEHAVAFFKETDDPFALGVAISSVGELHLAKGGYKEAIEHFDQALILCQKTSSNTASVEVLETKINLAKAHIFNEEPEIAFRHLHFALTHAETQGLTPMAMRCHQLLSEVNEIEGELPTALFHLKKHIELKELISAKANERELHHLQILHKTKEAQTENERLKLLRESDWANFQRLAQIKDDFLHHATHDIKNPLLIINTSTYLIRAKLSEQNESINRHIDQIDAQSERIRHLVEDVLDLAQLEAVPLNSTKPINLSNWLNDFENRFRILAESKNINLSVGTTPENLIGSINEQRLEQAIDNILSNALKYTPQGGRVHLSAIKQDAKLQIQIMDNGLGIPEESIPHLFDRFYRVNNQADNLEIEGTGLGLSIAKLSVEQQGGTIHVDSTINKGTTFSINLPQ
ncbi:MAG: ATP-binding protein [Anaerolineae bacterium]